MRGSQRSRWHRATWASVSAHAVNGWPRRSTAGLEQFALLAKKVGDGPLKLRQRFLHAVQPIAQNVKAFVQCLTLRFRQASPIANAAKVCNVLSRTNDLISQRLNGSDDSSSIPLCNLGLADFAEDVGGIPRGCTATKLMDE